jgi:hypothetical protein
MVSPFGVCWILGVFNVLFEICGCRKGAFRVSNEDTEAEGVLLVIASLVALFLGSRASRDEQGGPHTCPNGQVTNRLK